MFLTERLAAFGGIFSPSRQAQRLAQAEDQHLFHVVVSGITATILEAPSHLPALRCASSNAAAFSVFLRAPRSLRSLPRWPLRKMSCSPRGVNLTFKDCFEVCQIAFRHGSSVKPVLDVCSPRRATPSLSACSDLYDCLLTELRL